MPSPDSIKIHMHLCKGGQLGRKVLDSIDSYGDPIMLSAAYDISNDLFSGNG